MDRYITRVSPTKSPIKLENNHDVLASALGLTSPILLPQSPLKLGSRSRSSSPTRLSAQVLDLEEPLSPAKARENSEQEERRRMDIKYIIDTASLRDDFYSTLLAKCPHSDEIAVGLKNVVRLWSEQTGVKIPELPSTWGSVMCLDFNDEGLLGVGYSGGYICIYDRIIDVMLARLRIEAGLYPTSLKFKNTETMYAGDSKGNIYAIGFLPGSSGRRRLKILAQKQAAPDIICGLEFNQRKTRLVTGANDGSLSIWNIEGQNGYVFELVTSVNHGAAIKAITFFPQLNDLMVTGGGRADHTLRVWDLSTNSPQSKFNLPAQVTGFVWLGKYELFVALGHARGGPVRMGQVYRFDKGECRHLFDVTDSSSNTASRAVCCIKTNNGLCVGVNTKKLYFFQWQGKHEEWGHYIRKHALMSPTR